VMIRLIPRPAPPNRKTRLCANFAHEFAGNEARAHPSGGRPIHSLGDDSSTVRASGSVRPQCWWALI
jgi:hypothetical protein